jgi:hypothetical protein
MGCNGIEEIKAHPFFKGIFTINSAGINWENIRNTRAPILPKMIIPEEQKEKREKDREKMQHFLNELKAKEHKKKSQDVTNKLNEQLKSLQRLDLLVNLNKEEAEGLR